MKPLLQKTLIFLTASTILFSCKAADLEPTPEPAPEPAPMLNVEQSELSFSDDAAESYIDVTSNVEWWLSGATEWCSVDKSSGNGTQKVKVTVSANQEYEGRSVQLAFSVKGITKIVKITQSKKGALIVGKTLYEVDSNGGVIDVEIRHNVDFSIDVPSQFSSWIKSASTKAINTTIERFEIARNSDYDNRTGYIVVSGNNQKDTIHIYQSQVNTIILSKKLYAVPPIGGLIDVEVMSNLPYSVIIPSDATWIKQIATRGLIASNLQFSVDLLPEGVTVRKTDISIKDATTNTTETLTVRQVAELSLTLKTPGTLRNLLTYDEKMFAVSIILTGELNYSDFATMRDEMPLLKYVDISKTSTTVIPNSAFWDKASIESIALPETVRTIEFRAFSGCSSLTAINIPVGVTTIESSTFEGCSSLTAINIPVGVTTIGRSTFYGCSSLTAINISAGVTTIGSYAFKGCSSLTAINIPAGVTTIEDRAFDGCSSLTSINIPAGVTAIGRSTFSGCSSLTSINIPAGVTTIEDNAFKDCSSLTAISIPVFLTTIKSNTFYGCSSLTAINIPARVTTIEDNAFSGCSSLTSINIPAGVTAIGRSTFYGCSSLTSINIPAGVTTIVDYAFSGCSSLTSINIPAGVTAIGRSTFSGCSSLTSINIPAGVTTIEDNAFWRCRNLQEVICNTTTPPTIENWGTFRETPTTKILKVPSGSVEAYKQSNWSNDFKNIQPIQ